MKKTKKNSKRAVLNKQTYMIVSLLLFPLSLLFYELYFNVSTVNELHFFTVLYMMLFSIGGGLLTYFIVFLFPKKVRNYLIPILLFLYMLPFTVEYFVYKMFKVFYDINTVVGGAGGVMGDFLGQALAMVFAPSGLLHIFVFMLPFIIYMVFLRKVAPQRERLFKKTFVIVTAVFSLLLGSATVRLNPAYAASYTSEYNFEDAVADFGLLTGLRLDIMKNIFGGSDDFTGDSSKTKTKKTNKNPQEVEYGLNELDIDFKALASTTSSKTMKSLDEYVASLTPSSKNKYTGLFKGKNLIFLTCEAFTDEVIDPVLTPTLYRLAHKGINFEDYYVQATAGTTGGEYENIFGLLPMAGGKSFKNKVTHKNYMTMGYQLDRLGYYGLAMHNNTYTFYSRNKTHVKLGYSGGYIGYGNGMEKYVKKTWPESDLEMLSKTFKLYENKQPFNIYAMTVSGHSGYTTGGNAMTRKHWDQVKDLSKYNKKVKGYIACNLELEDAMTDLLERLEKKGILDDTVIVMSSDHFPYGLDAKGKLGAFKNLSNLKGYNVKTMLQRDRNRLIIWSGSLEKQDPIVVKDPCSSIDILPTLSNLFGLKFDSRLFPGRDVFSDAQPLMFNTGYDWKTDLGTYNARKKTFTPKKSKADQIPDGYVAKIRKIVANKINFCRKLTNSDYYRHVFKDYKITYSKSEMPVFHTTNETTKSSSKKKKQG